MSAIRLNPKETAKLLRTVVLKKAFPKTTFRVTTGRGAGVSSVRVTWQDGPTVAQVEALTSGFEIGSFNGMTDSYEYSKTEDRQLLVDGIHYEAGCRYVMTERSLSAAKANECIKMVAAYWGGVEGALPVAVDTEYGYQIEGNRGNESVRPDLGGHEYDWSTQIHRCASDPSRFVREEVAPAKPASEPVAIYKPTTWTDITALCRGCGDVFRISREALDDARKQYGEPDARDAEIAQSIDFCWHCANGEIIEAEKAGLNNQPDSDPLDWAEAAAMGEIPVTEREPISVAVAEPEARAPKLVLAQIDYNNFDRLNIAGLDQALYVASCFVGNSPNNEVVILVKVVDNSERYAVLDAPLANFHDKRGLEMVHSEGWSVVFALRRLDDQK